MADAQPALRTAVLGVTGSIAAYRAADIARELMRHGFIVRVCLTESAEKFVTRSLFEGLTGQPCLQDTFEEPTVGRMAHIDWARQADVLIVAPASANTLAKLAQGIADDMLSTIATVFTGPVVIAPAMNPAMYASDGVRAAIKTLGPKALIVEPAEGDVACGEKGQGKLASIERIVEAAVAMSRRSEILKGKRILITSGPTQEPIDDVRFISNRSSGKMGMALARAALLLGAEVTLVTGPTAEHPPYGAKVIHIRTTSELHHVCLKEAGANEWVIGAAAVADYRPKDPAKGKMRSGDEDVTLKLTPNPDVLAELATKIPLAIGFAAEPDSSLDTAKEKIKKKGLFAIAANDVSKPGIGFDADDNDITLVFQDGHQVKSGKQSKFACAIWMLEQIAARA
ncbi:MAG: bifunctional phosphopantothenoylcysteine decarboxylase/phosphopantothenate--cysteine ligase CoaBC [Armatimonadetes bacterium]|nr:bifunctional phosphopantothenoylcysteine decarboxylase/phosphopantothenate--cysteine ligase CoaBC [Armatimonadota bacterium]